MGQVVQRHSGSLVRSSRTRLKEHQLEGRVVDGEIGVAGTHLVEPSLEELAVKVYRCV